MIETQKQKRKILVTVGTTEFEELIKYVDSKEFAKILEEIDGSKAEKNNDNERLIFKSFDVLLQIGAKQLHKFQFRALYEPKHHNFIRLSNSILLIYQESDFIICHGGAGTLLENLRNNKKIIAVANNTLAENHQVELIKKLYEEGYLLGFESVDEMKQNEQKIKDFLSDKIKFKQYQKVTKSVLNDIIFDDD